MHVEVRDALADDVVDGDERAIAVESDRHASRDTLHSFEECCDEIGIEVDKCHSVSKWHNEDVSFEKG